VAQTTRFADAAPLLRLRNASGISDELAYYDNYPRCFRDAVPVRCCESERITLAALARWAMSTWPSLRRGFAGRWMNALPRQGKAAGAYMKRKRVTPCTRTFC